MRQGVVADGLDDYMGVGGARWSEIRWWAQMVFSPELPAENGWVKPSGTVPKAGVAPTKSWEF